MKLNCRPGPRALGLVRANRAATGHHFLEAVLGLELGVFRTKQSEDCFAGFIGKIDFEKFAVMRRTVAEPQEQSRYSRLAGDVADALGNLLNCRGNDLLHAVSMRDGGGEMNGKKCGHLEGQAGCEQDGAPRLMADPNPHIPVDKFLQGRAIKGEQDQRGVEAEKDGLHAWVFLVKQSGWTKAERVNNEHQD